SQWVVSDTNRVFHKCPDLSSYCVRPSIGDVVGNRQAAKRDRWCELRADKPIIPNPISDNFTAFVARTDLKPNCDAFRRLAIHSISAAVHEDIAERLSESVVGFEQGRGQAWFTRELVGFGKRCLLLTQWWF